MDDIYTRMKRDRAERAYTEAWRDSMVPATSMPRTLLIPALSKDLYLALQPSLQFFLEEKICLSALRAFFRILYTQT